MPGPSGPALLPPALPDSAWPTIGISKGVKAGQPSLPHSWTLPAWRDDTGLSVFHLGHTTFLGHPSIPSLDLNIQTDDPDLYFKALWSPLIKRAEILR